MTPAQTVDRNRAQIAAMAQACTDALATGGNPFDDERGVALYDAAYHLFECDELVDRRDTLLADLGLDIDGYPLDDEGFTIMGETMHEMQRSLFDATRGVAA